VRGTVNRLGSGICTGAGRGAGGRGSPDSALGTPGMLGALGALGEAGAVGGLNIGVDAGDGSFRNPGMSGDPLLAPPYEPEVPITRS
jgi:hypothetical protein